VAFGFTCVGAETRGPELELAMRRWYVGFVRETAMHAGEWTCRVRGFCAKLLD